MKKAAVRAAALLRIIWKYIMVLLYRKKERKSMVNFIKRPQDWDAPESCHNCGEGIDRNTPHYRNLNTGRAYCTECGTMFDPWQVKYYDRGEDELIQ